MACSRYSPYPAYNSRFAYLRRGASNPNPGNQRLRVLGDEVEEKQPAMGFEPHAHLDLQQLVWKSTLCMRGGACGPS